MLVFLLYFLAMKKNSLLLTRLIKICDWGFSLDKLDLRIVVAAYLQKQGRNVKKFPNNIPGDEWASNFMRRWQLTHRLATNIRRKRAKITKLELDRYFDNIEKVCG